MIRITLLGALTLAWLCAPASDAVRADGAGLGDPVILVHGWHGAGARDILDDASLAPLGRQLRAGGFEPVWAADVAVDPADTVFDSADTLAAVVARTAAARPGRPLRIVAHSYGGIVARALLESDRYTKLQAQGIHVSHLVTLGAPMGGVELWLPLLFVLGNPFSEPSVWELTPAWMAEFNRSHHPVAGTRYTVIAGDARNQVPPLWLLPASDGAITVASAHSLPEHDLGITERLTDDVHSATGYTRLLGWRALVDDGGMFARILLPALSGSTADPRSAASGPVTAVAARTAGGFVHTPVGRATLAPGARFTLPTATAVTAWMVLAPASVRPVEPADRGGNAVGSSASAGPSAGTVVPGLREGGVGRVLPAGDPGIAASFVNDGPQPAELAWLGLVPPDRAPLRVSVRPAAGRLAVSVSAAGRPLHDAQVSWLDRAHDRAQSLRLAAAAATSEALLAEAAAGGGVYYVQASAEVNGLTVQTETSAWVAGATLEGSRR